MIPQYVFEPTIPIYFRECRSCKTSKSLIIAFTSHGNHGKKFDLYKVLDSYNKTHQLFLSTSTNEGCYFDGISNTLNTENKVIDIIKEIIKEYNIQNVVTIGNSCGGIGSIIYGFQLAKFIKTSIVACSIRWGSMERILNYCKEPTPFKNNFKVYIDFNHKADYNASIQLQPLMELMHCEKAEHNVLKVLYLSNKLFPILDGEIHPDDINNNLDVPAPTVTEYYIQSLADEG